MRSPVLAMLWENWRLTRVEAAWKLALGIVAASAVLVVFAAVAPERGRQGLRRGDCPHHHRPAEHPGLVLD